MNEFDFIRRYLNRAAPDQNVLLGIGDDAALIRPNAGETLCISSDMLLAGRHFFADDRAEDIAHKVLAVNLSDMAAMGGTPRWVLLSAALPDLNPHWLENFCATFFALCQEYGVTLVGGDTTRGPLVFNVTIIGTLPERQALTRARAQIGDDIWVSGSIGLAAAGLQHHLNTRPLPPAVAERCLNALRRPQPRVALGQALLPLANAAMDISDGLAQDLGHILRASQTSAELWADELPTLPELRDIYPSDIYYETLLAGGDDYELLFTAAPRQRGHILQAAQTVGVAVSRIGIITAERCLNILNRDGNPIHLTKQGFDHFD